MPMLVVYETCEQFLRTVPSIALDEENIEVIEEGQEDHCLTGDTELITRDGVFKIKDLVGTSGKILTVGGSWTAYHDCRKTRRNAEVVQVEFDDGSVINCTPDHKILTLDGFVEARGAAGAVCFTEEIADVQLEEVLWSEYESLTRLLKSSTDNDSGYVGLTLDPLTTVLNCCTKLYGNITTEKPPKDTTSTTRISTEPTTTLKISDWSKAQNISPFTENWGSIPRGFLQCTKGRNTGTDPLKGLNGTKPSISNTANRQSRALKLMEFARFVEIPSRTLNTQDSVLGTVKLEPGNYPNEQLGTVSFVAQSLGESETLVLNLARLRSRGRPVKVVAVRLLGKEDVYCLVADLTHAIVAGNHVVISQCYDEACHICMARPIGPDLVALGVSAAVHEAAGKIKRLDTASRVAAQELFMIKRHLVDTQGEVSESLLEDPSLNPASVGLNDFDFDDEISDGLEALLRATPQLRNLF
jgi:hypothetical protein